MAMWPLVSQVAVAHGFDHLHLLLLGKIAVDSDFGYGYCMVVLQRQ